METDETARQGNDQERRLSRRPGTKLIATFPDGQIVGMVLFKDTIYVATTHGVFYYDEGVLMPLYFEVPDDSA